MARLFLAVAVPAEIRQTLGELLVSRAEGQRMTGLRMVPPESMHVTLHFLGESDIGAVRTALQELAYAPFELTVAGVGRFPAHGRPSVLWAGINASATLAALHQYTAVCLRSMGYQPEERPYTPHITLARCGYRADSEQIEQFLKDNAALRLPSFTVEALYLYSSVSHDVGPVYTVEAEFPFQRS